jgi:hypothetical protein
MGYYGYETGAYKEYLKVLPVDSNPSAAFVPNKMEVSFDASLSNKVFEWLNTQGDKFIYIYGGSDTWSATAIPINHERKSLWIFMENTDHGHARIRNMEEEDQQKIYSKLEEWLGIEINLQQEKSWLQ